jgi:molecular chaperone GrpE (heat shock protein)
MGNLLDTARVCDRARDEFHSWKDLKRSMQMELIDLDHILPELTDRLAIMKDYLDSLYRVNWIRAAGPKPPMYLHDLYPVKKLVEAQKSLETVPFDSLRRLFFDQADIAVEFYGAPPVADVLRRTLKDTETSLASRFRGLSQLQEQVQTSHLSASTSASDCRIRLIEAEKIIRPELARAEADLSDLKSRITLVRGILKNVPKKQLRALDDLQRFDGLFVEILQLPLSDDLKSIATEKINSAVDEAGTMDGLHVGLELVERSLTDPLHKKNADRIHDSLMLKYQLPQIEKYLEELM